MLRPSLGVVFRRHVRLGSFPPCWRQANVSSIPKGPPSPLFANYRQISITSVLSKVFECPVPVRLGRFMECSGVLPSSQYSYRKGLGTCDPLLRMSRTLQSTLESGQMAEIVVIGFRAVFERVNHQIFSIIAFCGYCRLCVVTIFSQFLSNRSQHVMVDGYQSKLVIEVSGVQQGSVLGLLSFLLCYYSFFFSILEYKRIGYADYCTLFSVVPSPGIRVTVAENLNRDLDKVGDWCDL